MRGRVSSTFLFNDIFFVLVRTAIFTSIKVFIQIELVHAVDVGTSGADGLIFEDLVIFDDRTEDFEGLEAIDDGSLATLFLDLESRFDNFLDLDAVDLLLSSPDEPKPFSCTFSFEERSFVDLEYFTSVLSSPPTPTLCFLTLVALIKLTKRFNKEKGVFLARMGADSELSDDEVT